jgi:hypothetical protein
MLSCQDKASDKRKIFFYPLLREEMPQWKLRRSFEKYRSG